MAVEPEFRDRDPALLVHDGRFWRVAQRSDATLPGYLIVGAKDPRAMHLDQLSCGALQELGGVLAAVTGAVRRVLHTERVHVCRFGWDPGHPVHFHVIPVPCWMIDAYRRFTGTDASVPYPEFTDGPSVTLFVSEEFTRGRAPCDIEGPRVEPVIEELRKLLARDRAVDSGQTT